MLFWQCVKAGDHVECCFVCVLKQAAMLSASFVSVLKQAAMLSASFVSVKAGDHVEC